MTQTEALKLALEGITKVPTLTHGVLVKLSDVESAIKEALAQPEQWGASAITHPEYVVEQKRKTEELRSMLAQPEQEPVITVEASLRFNLDCAKHKIETLEDELKELKNKKAQPEQEPVAKVCHDLDGHIGWNPKLTQLPDEGTPLYTSTQLAQQKPICPFDAAHDALEKAAGIHISQQTEQQQEPVAQCTASDVWNCKYCRKNKSCDALEDSRNFASPQPSKPWVGLTQQDINIAFDDTQEGGGFDDFARAIEAKLKERNT